jgi:hypothetical protein
MYCFVSKLILFLMKNSLVYLSVPGTRYVTAKIAIVKGFIMNALAKNHQNPVSKKREKNMTTQTHKLNLGLILPSPLINIGQKISSF